MESGTNVPPFIQELSHSYTTKSVAIRRAVDRHREWIEAELGVPLSNAVILQTEYGFHNAAVRHVVGYLDPHAPVPIFRSRLAENIEAANVPESFLPIFEITKHRASSQSDAPLPLSQNSCAFEIEWCDGPVVISLKDMPVRVVALPVRHHAGPDSNIESQQDVVIIPRCGVEAVVALLKMLTRPDERATLQVGSGEPQLISECAWDELTLDHDIVTLLKNDFETFFDREDWFRKMRLPFRRGYLLHGPPGNGKSSAIRAMLSSRRLPAFTMRFFDQRVDDEHLERLFSRAAESAPSMVVLEDIDRVFPRNGQSRSLVSLQQLLNSLDGLATASGVLTVSTANNPTDLDPAILRRPGRFDRVVLFPNPTSKLRQEYFVKMQSIFADARLDTVVAETDGMSFAQLREVHIMAGQAAFLDGRNITFDDLSTSVRKIRHTTLFGSLTSVSTGFVKPPTANARHERRY